MNFFALLLKWAGVISELLPVAQLAVSAVQAAAPPGTIGSVKFDAATKAVHDTLNAASAASGAFEQTKAALAGGDAAGVAAAVGHSIEVALSVSKTFGLFPKAAIVQAAPELGDQMQPGGTG